MTNKTNQVSNTAGISDKEWTETADYTLKPRVEIVVVDSYGRKFVTKVDYFNNVYYGMSL